MGYPNADFFVREVRECLSGDMVVVRSGGVPALSSERAIKRVSVFCTETKLCVRLGSCGALIDVPVGSVVVPKGSIAVRRNYDFDFVSGKSDEEPYHLSKPVSQIYGHYYVTCPSINNIVAGHGRSSRTRCCKVSR